MSKKMKMVKLSVPAGDWRCFLKELPQEGQKVTVLTMMDMQFDGLSSYEKGKWGFNSQTSPKCVVAWKPIEESEDAEVQSPSGSDVVGKDEGCLEFDCPGGGQD